MDPDRVVVVAGATGQLGRAVAGAFAEDGCAIVALGRDPEALHGLVSGLPGGSDRHLGLECDPGDERSTASAAEEVVQRFGGATCLVDAIGGFRGETGIADAPADELDVMLDAHLRTAWNLLRAFLPQVRGATGGRVIAFSTTIAQAPAANRAAYAASKAALEALVLSAAKELAEADATANVVVLRAIGQDRRSQTSLEEIVAAVRWLCSPAAAAVNGQRIPLIGRG